VHGQMNDVLMLAAGMPIKKVRYDHATGAFTDPETVTPQNVILVSGLHSLFLKGARDIYSLTIFLDTAPELSVYWKTLRDQKERGYTFDEVMAQIRRRREDSERFIRPQMRDTDLVFSFQLADGCTIKDYMERKDEALKLVVNAVNTLDLSGLAAELEGEPDVRMDLSYSVDEPRAVLTLSGRIAAERIVAIAEAIIPNVHELVAAPRAWRGGLQGLQQLVTIGAVSQALRSKAIRGMQERGEKDLF
jgi:hypothetical protein